MERQDPQLDADRYRVTQPGAGAPGHRRRTGKTGGLNDLRGDRFLDNYRRFEERIYRLRCVEAWSMVIPWLGIPLAEVIKRAEPTSKARYVRFETLVDPEQMPGQRSAFSLIPWPYVEGLRLDEAMHPLTILAL